MSTKSEQFQAASISAERLTAKLAEEREALRAQIKPLQERLLIVEGSIRGVGEKLSERWIEEMGDAPDWPKIIKELAGGALSSIPLLQYAEKHLAKYDMRHSGYFHETGEAHLQIAMTTTAGSASRVHDGVRFFTGLIKPLSDGYVHFGIDDEACGANGIFDLLVKPNFSEAKITRTSWGKTTAIASDVSTLVGALRYIANNNLLTIEGEA
jgi:hypothetical protein